MTRLRWDGGDVFEPADEPGDIRIIDSWLVEDGAVRAFDGHVRRFTAACTVVCGVAAEEFVRAAAARIPAAGRWFPRAELALVSGSPRLQLWLRPAPPRRHDIRLWIPPEPDQRTCPRVKGPDLEYLARLRQAAVAADADEAVLLSPEGHHLLEGTTTSIVWWRDDTLCAPPPTAPLLPSVTRSVLLDAAAASGVPVAFEIVTPAELSGLTVWAVNALHGIRPATAWVAAGISPGPAGQATRWQHRLDRLDARRQIG